MIDLIKKDILPHCTKTPESFQKSLTSILNKGSIHTATDVLSGMLLLVALCDDVLLFLQAMTQVACASERTLPGRALRHCCSFLSSAARNPTLVSVLGSPY